MDTYQPPPPSKTCLTVFFYGISSFQTEPLFIPLDTPIPYEQALIQCAERLSKNLGQYFPRESEKMIGPLLLPLFGLYAKDHTLQQWVADCHVFNSSHAHQEFYFRIKVQLPATDKFAEKVPQGIFADYLFWQCADDFLTGRVWQLFGDKNKINNVDAVNFNVLHIFMASAQYHLHEMVKCNPTRVLNTPLKDITKLPLILQKVKFWNMLRHFPEKTTPELKREYNIKRDPFLRCISYRYLLKYIRQFFDINGQRTLRNLRMMFVNSLLKEYVLSYGLEFFDAEKVDKPGLPSLPVQLIVRPFQDGCTPGLYFNKKLVAPLQDILRVAILESESTRSEQKCNVFLEFRNQAALVLQLASRELAQSFVSVLDVYYRLKVNYHSSPLDDRRRAPSLRVLDMLRSYGPMQEEVARQLLRSRRREDRQCPDLRQYLIYQDCQLFGLLHVLATNVGSDSFTSYAIRFRPAQSESGFSFSVHASPETSDAMFETPDPRRVTVYLNDTLISQRVVPKDDELCGAMYLLKDDIEYQYYTEIPEGDRSGRRKTHNTGDGPMLYREDQVPVTDAERIAFGRFSQVFHITQVEQERKAILKIVTKGDAAVQEAHRKGAERLMKLREGCRFFIRVYGFVVTSPLRIVLESMPQGKGSLLHRIIDRDAPPFTWLHISSVLKQLAQCLDYLAKSGLIYGSFCCAKILILSENSGEDQHLTVRLGDPSVAMYLDTLPISNRQNEERVAWVAPERFQALSRHTVASEVYALGTTIWEMVALGKCPNTCLPPNTTSAIEFFRGNGKLPTDFLGAEAPPEVAKNGVSRAREWVDSQDFQQATAQDVQQTSDVEEYVTGAQCSNDSAPERVQTATEGGNAGGQEEAPAQNVPLQKLKMAIGSLIRDCWHSDPDQRPSTTDFQRRAFAVSRRVEEATQADMCWQQSIIVEQALQTGNVADIQNAQRIKQELRSGLQVQQDTEQMQADDRERIEKLEKEVRTSIACIIMADRLDFTGSRVLGKGNYGQVKTAKLSPESETRQAEEVCKKESVAVKMINSENHKPDDLALFLKEALCICNLEHRNIVKLKGIVLKGRSNPYQLVLEYADLGSMEKYVFDNQTRLGMPEFKRKLKKLAVDVAKGMEYVCRNSRVHGDLAARNVLLFRDSQGSQWPITAKLCDFGLSHQLSRGYYDLRRSANKSLQLPAYLLPPESLRGWDQHELKFTVQTDIWSYGIFLWEIFTNKKPENVLGRDPKKILEKYNLQYRLPQPDNCSPKMYAIMKDCWAEILEERPLFDTLVYRIEDLTDRDME